MRNKKVIYISSGIIFLFVITLFLYLSTFIQPKIVFTADITDISSEDYKRIMNNSQVMHPDKDIRQFKHINVQIKAEEPAGSNYHIKIERDILSQYLKNNKDIQILSGGSFEHGNGKEYAENIEIYLIDISENELRNMLGNFRYKVTWVNMWNKRNDKIFYFKDYLN